MNNKPLPSPPKICCRSVIFLTALLGLSLPGYPAPNPVTQPAEVKKTYTLRDCLKYALGYSPELQRKDIVRKNQKLNTTIERAEFDFNLGGDNSWTRNNPSTTQPGQAKIWDHSAYVAKKFPWGVDLLSSADMFDTTDESRMQGSYSVQMSKQILGGGTWTESMSKINTSIFKELIDANDVSKEKRRIVSQVKRQYYQVVRDMETLKVQEHILDRARQNLALATEREDPLDIENARAEIPPKQTEVLRARRQIKNSLDQLKVFIGLTVTDPFDIVPAFDYAPAEIDLKRDIDHAMKNHEDILNSGLRTQILKIDEKVTRTKSWPDVFLYAEHREGIRNDVDYLVNPGQTVGVKFFYPIGERASKARHEQARNNLIDESLQLYQITQDLTRNIRDQARELGELREAVQLQEDHVKVRTRIVELYKDRYDSGEIDILEYIRSENDLERAKVDLIDLKKNYMGLLADYKFSTAWE